MIPFILTICVLLLYYSIKGIYLPPSSGNKRNIERYWNRLNKSTFLCTQDGRVHLKQDILYMDYIPVLTSKDRTIVFLTDIKVILEMTERSLKKDYERRV
jgi:hypothetical protein